jgi:D-alanine-D-alanine ligase
MPLSVGLCYDHKEEYLAAGFLPVQVMEFDDEETISGLAQGLESLGHHVERIGHGVELARRLVAGDRWDLLFNVAEGVHGRSREAHVPALAELFSQAYTFADPLTSALTLDKAMAKRVVRDAGLPTADFAYVAGREDLQGIDLKPPLFVKPVAEGSSKGVTGRSFVNSAAALEAACTEMLESYEQPVIVEQYLPGREMTVGIVGNGRDARVIAVMEVSITGGDEGHSYTALNKKEWQQRVSYRLLDGELAGESRRVALAAYRVLGCRDGARIDLRCDAEGAPNFLEANPLPGLNAVWSDLPLMTRMAGSSYRDLLGWIVEAARRRYGL